MQIDPVIVTTKVTSALEKLDVPYFIGGSLASTLYGMVRTTQDADIITMLDYQHIQALIKALESDFYMDDEMIIEAVSHHSSFNIIHRESMFKVDVFIPGDRDFLHKQFDRARREILSTEPEILERAIKEA